MGLNADLPGPTKNGNSSSQMILASVVLILVLLCVRWLRL